MNNIQEILMNIMNNTGLNAEDFVLLVAAQSGNKEACARLYTNHTAEFERMHRYGPDGKHPKNFGFNYSKNGASYEEASGYCYICFYDSVMKYDMKSGVPFMAWVRKIFAKRGLDWVDDRNPDNFLFEGDAISESGETLREEDSSVSETFYEGRFVSANDFENASADVFRMKMDYSSSDEDDLMDREGVEQIRRYLHKVDDPKLERFVESWLSLGETKKNPITDVADQMKVKRQTAYNYMDSAKALVKAHFGNHFYGRD